MNNRSEMDKLEKYLKDNLYIYERKSKFNGEILIVYDEDHNTLWDVICHEFSYGYEKGLLEACGEIVEGYDPESDYFESVEGYLTAADIIERLEKRRA